MAARGATPGHRGAPPSRIPSTSAALPTELAPCLPGAARSLSCVRCLVAASLGFGSSLRCGCPFFRNYDFTFRATVSRKHSGSSAVVVVNHLAPYTARKPLWCKYAALWPEASRHPTCIAGRRSARNRCLFVDLWTA